MRGVIGLALACVVVVCGCGGPSTPGDGGIDGGERDGGGDPACSGVADGMSCGTGMVCMAHRCVSSAGTCGNGSVEPGEDCDDGNTTAFDGCEPGTCTLTCDADAVCDDGIECNGAEACADCADEACTAGRACTHGTPLGDDTPCTRDDDSVGKCRSDVCVPPQCGNGTVEAPEHCDDGNTTNGDGCEVDCRFTCEVDPTMPNVWYLDCDDDGFAAASPPPRTECLQPEATSCGGGWTLTMPVAGATDCDDTKANIRPGAPELCDGIDQNCDGSLDGGCMAIPCTEGTECPTGFCADGVCCDTACTGQCEQCNGDTPGTCTQVAGPPVGERPACGGTGVCGGACGSSRTACDYPGSETTCSAQMCTGSTLFHAATCDGTGSCPAPSTDSCMAYGCNGTTCRTSCSGDGDCSEGNFCNTGVCLGTKPRGYACGGSGECTSGYCVDGVCCDRACNGQCEACNGATPGTCAPHAGTPVGARPACNTDSRATNCNGTCDGVNGASCAYPTSSCSYCGFAGTVFSRHPVAVTGATCSNGTCSGGTTANCGNYVCRTNFITRQPFCPTSCDSTDDCYFGDLVAGYCVSAMCTSTPPSGG